MSYSNKRTEDGTRKRSKSAGEADDRPVLYFDPYRSSSTTNDLPYHKILSPINQDTANESKESDVIGPPTAEDEFRRAVDPSGNDSEDINQFADQAEDFFPELAQGEQNDQENRQPQEDRQQNEENERPGFFSRLWGGIKSVGKAIGRGAKSVAKTVWGGVKKAGKAVWGKMKSFGHNFKKFFKAFWILAIDMLINDFFPRLFERELAIDLWINDFLLIVNCSLLMFNVVLSDEPVIGELRERLERRYGFEKMDYCLKIRKKLAKEEVMKLKEAIPPERRRKLIEEYGEEVVLRWERKEAKREFLSNNNISPEHRQELVEEYGEEVVLDWEREKDKREFLSNNNISPERRQELVEKYGEEVILDWEYENLDIGRYSGVADPYEFRRDFNAYLRKKRHGTLGSGFYEKSEIKWRKRDISGFSDDDLKTAIKELWPKDPSSRLSAPYEFFFSSWEVGDPIRYKELTHECQDLFKKVILTLIDIKDNGLSERFANEFKGIDYTIRNHDDLCSGRAMNIITTIASALDSIEFSIQKPEANGDDNLKWFINCTLSKFRKNVFESAVDRYGVFWSENVHLREELKNTFSEAFAVEFVNSAGMRWHDVYDETKCKALWYFTMALNVEDLYDIAESELKLMSGAVREQISEELLKTEITIDDCNSLGKTNAATFLERYKDDPGNQGAWDKLNFWVNSGTKLTIKDLYYCRLDVDNMLEDDKEFLYRWYYDCPDGTKDPKFIAKILYPKYLLKNGIIHKT